ncbi:hypothetical protein AAZX31_15G190400 [Glycine max]|uniref:uncharacterized protein LOC114387915 n=1 Tax=Glycine soja TaxID=3848 RepID=UPI00103EC9F3|nr:uncharacterized protein LOC114387915 [Glycine soja]
MEPRIHKEPSISYTLATHSLPLCLCAVALLPLSYSPHYVAASLPLCHRSCVPMSATKFRSGSAICDGANLFLVDVSSKLKNFLGTHGDCKTNCYISKQWGN